MTEGNASEYDDLLRDDRVYFPSPAFQALANVSDGHLYENGERDSRVIGPDSPTSSSGYGSGTECSSGNHRTPSGSSAAN